MTRELSTLEKKLVTMQPYKLVRVMVASLRKPWTDRVDMRTFGGADTKYNICFGCAATNTLCELAKKAFTVENIGSVGYRADFLGIHPLALGALEVAIDNLRTWNIWRYNFYIGEMEHILQSPTKLEIPWKLYEKFRDDTTEGAKVMPLGNRYTKADLKGFTNFAKFLEQEMK